MSGHKCLTSPHCNHQMESTISSTQNHRHHHLHLLLLFLLPIDAAFAKPLLPKQPLPTKSGYLPINPTTSSAIFYTFYEAQNLTTTTLSKTPLLIWLQGGPGCSSMIGNFFELGPWRVNFNKQPSEPLALEPNPGSWNRIFGLIFIDNPIGTGFSIASSPQEIPRDQISVAKDLFAAITKFIELDPVFKTRPIYITGESYAGKFVPAIGYYILKRNAEVENSKRVNLGGVAIGNGMTDPVIQVGTHAVNAYYSGLINEKQRAELEELQKNAIRLVNAGNWSAATNARNRVLKRLQNMTGLATLNDYTKQESYKTSLVEEFLRYKEVKTALGANRSPDFEECSDLVGDVLHEDVMKSVKFMVEFLVKKSKVLLYQGQNDLRDGPVSTEAWVKTMKWEGIGRFMAADRKVWKMGKEVSGYVQKWGSLSQVFVAGGGHLLPADQPLRAQKMIEDWVLDQGLFGYGKENNLSSNFVGSKM